MTFPGPLPRRVRVYEVGPRDGLQNEAATLSTDDKVALVERLAAGGLPAVECTSFVSPKWIPTLADGDEVARRVRRRPATTLSALVPNARGLDRARAAGLTEVAVFLSASETHNRKNINKTVAEALDGYRDVVAAARAAGLAARAYVSTVFGCPYEGDVDPARVVELTRALIGMGCYQVSLGDTVGVADPAQVGRVLERVLAAAPAEALALHMHDTRGTALANVLVGLACGVATVDSAIGGLGGCPYAPGASGNLATEDLVAMLHAMGIETGVDLDALVDTSAWLEPRLGHELPSRAYKAIVGARRRAQEKR